MDWLAFAGSILGGLIGGLFTYFGVRLTLKHEMEKEKKKQILKADAEKPRLEIVKFLNFEETKHNRTILIHFNLYKNAHPECFIKQWYDYGKRAEYDFHQIKVKVAGEVKVYHQVTISLPKSNYVFGLLYKNENIKTVLDSIIRFINHCDGVFEEMVFDNMSTVVKG